MKKTTLAIIVTGLMATSAQAATVDFEGLSTSFLSSSETIGGFTFNAQGGSVVRIYNDNPNPRTTYLLACVPGDCQNSLEILFPNATDIFSMNVVSDDNTAASLSLTFATAGGPLNYVYNSFDGDPNTKDFLSFSGLGGATSVFLTPTDPSGFGYDDIHVSSVPVPAAAWLFGSGLIALTGIARRRKS